MYLMGCILTTTMNVIVCIQIKATFIWFKDLLQQQVDMTGNWHSIQHCMTHSKCCIELVVVIKSCCTLIGRQHDEMFSERSTASRITTSTSRHPSEREQLQSLSCTHYASDFIFYISLLQALAFHYLLS